MEFETISTDDFEQLPDPTRKSPKSTAWEPVLDALERGEVVRLAYADEKEMRGKRLALGRRAKSRGFSAEIRYGDGFIAARKRDGAPQGQAAKPRQPRKRREGAEAS